MKISKQRNQVLLRMKNIDSEPYTKCLLIFPQSRIVLIVYQQYAINVGISWVRKGCLSLDKGARGSVNPVQRHVSIKATSAYVIRHIVFNNASHQSDFAKSSRRLSTAEGERAISPQHARNDDLRPDYRADHLLCIMTLAPDTRCRGRSPLRHVYLNWIVFGEKPRKFNSPCSCIF